MLGGSQETCDNMPQHETNLGGGTGGVLGWEGIRDTRQALPSAIGLFTLNLPKVQSGQTFWV